MKNLMLLALFLSSFEILSSQEQWNDHLNNHAANPVFSPGNRDFTQDTINIREVEVLSGRKLYETALRISRPDSLVLHSGLSVDLSELLSRYSPVFIKSYGKGSQAMAYFRGTSASHTRVIWNGITLNSPMRGYTDLSQLPLFFVDDMVLLHGGSSLSSSSGALGGIIHLENLPDWGSKLAWKGALERGSFHTSRVLASVRAGSTRIQSVTRMLVETSENNFPFFNTGIIPNRRDTLNNGDYRKKGVLQEVYFRSENDLTLTLRGWYQQNHRNLPPLMSYEGRPREEHQKDDQFRLQFGLKKYSGKMIYQYTSGLTYARMKYFFRSLADNYIIRDAVSDEKSFFNLFKFQVKNPGVLFTSSLESAFIRVHSDEKVKGEGYHEQRLESGLLFHLQVQPTQRSGIYLLNRSEMVDRKLIPFVPSAGAEWQVGKDFPLFLKINATRNYHQPGLNDLYWNPGGNPLLHPEEGLTGEVMLSSPLKWKSGSFSQEMSWYASAIKNWIMWQPAASGAWYWEATNLPEVRSYGLEYSGKGNLIRGPWKVDFGGNYAFTRTYQPEAMENSDQSRHYQLIYIPKHAANMYVSVTRQKWSVLSDLSYTGRRFTRTSGQSSHFENSLSPFCLVNVSIQKQFKRESLEWGVKWKIENLLDARYQQILWRPMPERNYSFTLIIGYKK